MGNAETILIALVVIATGILIGQWLANKLAQVPDVVTQGAAAEVVTSAPTSVEEFLDRY